ncbi:DNA repair RAD16 [Fusarium subglutinans]|uniref:DNA repair RAD16 n=1 Tax=Gibberella subglutinans TaxID=42677 RepID=A0A8H5L6L5_GIBSU|nr:DNA repair RAD16 [Fusarium subglutinans]KAF5586287.1 DNA repair RAD16 [Fusarium subglutinans]
MADTTSMSVEEIQEELTVQKVVLESLSEATYDGAEDMRQEAHSEIVRLKKLLQTLKLKKEPTTTKDGESEASKAMQSPSRHGVWRLPDRKRGADSARLSFHDNHAKTRRISPEDHTFSTDMAYGNADDHIDFIDLTGDDDDIESDFIAEQLKAEERQKQEWADQQLARQLSSQGPSNQPSGSQSSQNNAFTRLMNSQPALSTPLDDADDDLFWIPGAYDARWDDSSDAGPAFNIPQRQMVPQYIPVAASSNHNAIKDDPDLIFAGSVTRQPPTPSGRPILASGMNYPDLTRRHPGAPPAGVWPNNYSSPGSSTNFSGLADLTRWSSGLDFVSGLDADGRPINPQLMSFAREADSFHTPQLDQGELDALLKNISADMDLPKAGLGKTPEGLKRPLYPHQDIALAWMKKMESGTNKGGILADDMGLGKTISTLSLLLDRRAPTRPKTNLIVAPVALLRQWEEEIATKTKPTHRLSVYIHHGKKASIDELLRYDVVLTTYGTVAQEFKRVEKIEEDHKERGVVINWNDMTISSKLSLLHPKAKFYRIILDEAQCIKNKDTKGAKACTKLSSIHRWCLTGTPMMNGIIELYSLVRFLQIKPYSQWEKFQQGFGVLFGRKGDPKHSAMEQLQALLKAIMLRRKKSSKLNGKPILVLPEKTEEIIYAELSPEERDFYSQLEKHARVQFSKYLREGTVSRNYSNILVLLLRLRQACCHPHLNLDVDEAASSSIPDEEKQQLVKELDQAIVDRIKEVEGFECPICYDAVQCPSFFIPCGHDSCSECLVKIVESASAVNLQEGNESSRAKCPVCRGQFDPAKCFSYETFREVHMPETVKKESSTEPAADESDAGDDSETESESVYESDDEVDKKGNLKGFIVNDEFPDEDEKVSVKKQSKGKGKRKDKGKGKSLDVKPAMLKTLRKEAYKNREAFKKYMRYLRKTWEPAAKVTECMNLIKKIEETGEKTIIFSQWTLLLDLLQVAMSHEKMAKPERYDGSMSATLRNVAAQNFRERKDTKVMLVSLRAGNAGLNLTAASRVIIMDPFWNPYIEMQAVDRAYRIGQQQEVKVYRILTKETVEDRIVELQNQKKEMVEAALDETAGSKIGRLSINDLKNLFGFSR